MAANTSNSKKRFSFSRDLLLDIFYPGLNDEEAVSIARYLQSLISKTHSSIQEEFTAELNKINHFTLKLINHSTKRKETKSNVTIVDVYRRIKKGKLLMEHPATAFVCCSLTSRTYRQEKFDHYKVLVLVAAVRLAEIGTNDSPIHSVFLEVRQLGEGYREDLAKFLPDANEYDIASLIEFIDETRNQESISSNIKRCLSGYYIALDHAYYSKEGRTRKGSNNERNKMVLVQSEKTEETEQADANVIQIRETFKSKTKSVEQWQREEEDTSVDDHPAFSVVSLNQQAARDLREQQLKGKRIVDWIARKKQRVPCDFQSLTHHELTILARQIFADINSTEGSAALCYLLSLLTGRHITIIKQQIAASSKLTQFKKQFTALTVKHQVDTYRQENAVKHLLREVKTSVTLFLPPIPASSIKTSPLDSTAIEDTWLKQINKHNNTRLTSHRIANQIYVFQRQQQLDEVLCHIISGQETQKVSGTPYTHATSEQLQCFLNQYFQWLAELTGISALSSDTLTHNNESALGSQAVGSPLYLNEQHIIATNQRHIHHLEQLKNKGMRFVLNFTINMFVSLQDDHPLFRVSPCIGCGWKVV